MNAYGGKGHYRVTPNPEGRGFKSRPRHHVEVQLRRGFRSPEAPSLHLGGGRFLSGLPAHRCVRTRFMMDTVAPVAG